MAHELIVRHLVADELAVLTKVFLEREGWTLNTAEFPHLDVTFHGSKSLRIRLNYEDWPDRPPSAELLETNGEVLNCQPFAIFNMSAHPVTGRPFICMRGFNEYHTHYSHVSELWEQYRGQDGNNLVGLLMQVSRSWRTVHPR